MTGLPLRWLLRAGAGLLAWAALCTSPALAQSVHLGADLTSRYVWRGTDFGESVSVQPALELETGSLVLGTWASYSWGPDGAGANEHDLYLSLTRGPVTVGLTDYYFPAPGGARFFDFEGEGEGAHSVELYGTLSGGEDLPLRLYAGVFAHNDPDHSVYLEGRYPLQLKGAQLEGALGFVTHESGLYETDGPALVNLSLSASRSVRITDQFSLPLSVTYILNAETQRTFLVFGVSL